MTETDFYAPDWLELNWSEWKPLDADPFSEVPKEAGPYRVRHQSESRDHLEYIGESGDTRRRIQSLTRGSTQRRCPTVTHIRRPRAYGQFEMALALLSKSHTPLPRKQKTSNTGKE